MDQHDGSVGLSLPELFRAAALVLAGEAPAEGAARGLLEDLLYLDDAAGQTAHRAAVLRAASCFTRIFTLDAAEAPGLVMLGAEVDPACIGVQAAGLAGVSGAAATFRQAFESCVGEGVEYLSQFETGVERVEPLTADEALTDALPAMRGLWDYLLPYRRDQAAPRTAWVLGADLASGRPVWLPADLCLRRPAGVRDIDPPWPLSNGCAAGADHLSETLHGLLELIERDAVALWWRGGRRARVMPSGAATGPLAVLRGSTTRRCTWLLDITNDIRVPVAVAASCNEDGFGLCCGSAARPTLAAAADAALREMAQMEVASALAATKLAQRGDGGLNPGDRQHLQRFTTVDVAGTPALQPLAPPLPSCDLTANDARDVLAEVRTRLQAVGLAPGAVNLTRDTFGIPVVRVICPGLEAGLSSAPGPRLADAARRSGTDPMAVVPL